MALNVTVTGKGTIGDITQGWSVDEYTTPVNPIESAGGTGAVNFSAGAKPESLLLVSGSSTSGNELGTISGKITSVSQSGLGVSFVQDNKLSRLDVDRVIPPMQAGSVPGALDLVDQLTGTVRLNQEPGVFFSMAGHCAGFDSSGGLVTFGQSSVTYRYYDATSGAFKKSVIPFYRNAVWATQYNLFGSSQYAKNMTGDSFQIIDKYTGYFWNTSKNSYTKNRVALKTVLNGANILFEVVGGPDDSNLGTGQVATVKIDPVAATLTVEATYRSGGVPTTTTSTVATTGLNLANELAVFIEFTYDETNATPVADGYLLNVNVCNTSDYATKVHTNIFYGPDGMDLWFEPFTVSGNTRAVWREEKYFGAKWDVDLVLFDWENPPQFTTVGAQVPSSPVIGFEGNCWQYLQAACATYLWEITLISDSITCRPVGSASITPTEYVGAPSIVPSISSSARQVDVNYTGAKVVEKAEVYNAKADNNQILSVGVAQTTVTTVGGDSYLQTVIKPSRVTSITPPVGTYVVIDSTGLMIVAEQWEDFGGDLSVALDPNARGGITVTLTGPRIEIPSTTAPYSVAVSDGENQYAALSILGTGITTTPGVLNLLTGADPAKIKQEVGSTITSPFIATETLAYTTGIRSSVEMGGPKVNLSMVLGLKHVTGFGVTPGALIRYGKSQYRVLSSTLSAKSVQVEAVKNVTVAEFDAIYINQNVSEHDKVWAGYTCSDQDIFPFKQPEPDPNSLGFGLDPFGETGFGSVA